MAFTVELDPELARTLAGFDDGIRLAVDNRDDLYKVPPAELTAAADELERDYPTVPIVLGYARALRVIAADIRDREETT